MIDYDDTIMIVGIDTHVYSVNENGLYIIQSDLEEIEIVNLNKEDIEILNIFLKEYMKDIYSGKKESFLYTNLKIQVSHLINKYKKS